MGLDRRGNGSIDQKRIVREHVLGQRLHHTGNQSFVGHLVTSTMFCEVRDLVHDDLPTSRATPDRAVGLLTSGGEGPSII